MGHHLEKTRRNFPEFALVISGGKARGPQHDTCGFSWCLSVPFLVSIKCLIHWCFNLIDDFLWELWDKSQNKINNLGGARWSSCPLIEYWRFFKCCFELSSSYHQSIRICTMMLKLSWANHLLASSTSCSSHFVAVPTMPCQSSKCAHRLKKIGDTWAK